MGNQDETVFVNYEKSKGPDILAGNKVERTGDPLEQAYLELGRAYYEGGFEDPLPQLLPLFDRITRLKKEKEARQSFCPGCGSPVRKEAVFCGTCGFRLRSE